MQDQTDMDFLNDDEIDIADEGVPTKGNTERERRMALGLDDRVVGGDFDESTVAEVTSLSKEERELRWGFTHDELAAATKVVNILFKNPGLYVGDPVLAETRLYTMVSRDRRTKRNNKETMKVAMREEKNRKKRMAKEEDLAAIQKTKMKQERDAALQALLLPPSDGDDETGQAQKLLTASRETQHENNSPTVVHRPKKCHTCKNAYTELHHFYYCLCPPCGDINFLKRSLKCNLRGRTVLLTGCRIKIGYAMACSLLRCGATLVGTSRFIHDAQQRFMQEDDYADWKDRLHLYAVDLRDLWMVHQFCAFLGKHFPKLHAVINNAAQTIQRTPEYTAQLRHQEMHPPKAARENLLRDDSTVEWMSFFLAHGSVAVGQPLQLHAHPISGADSVFLENQSTISGDNNSPTNEQAGTDSSVVVHDTSKNAVATFFPKTRYDRYDTVAESLDVRETNSWTMNLEEVSGGEASEVMAINALAPLILNAKLKPLLTNGLKEETEMWQRMHDKAKMETEEFDEERWTASMVSQNNADSVALCNDPGRYIINVSAMEGQFYRHKQTTHPHTNMAKAALNMMTRTSGEDYKRSGIYMNSVDTGWITDESPHTKKQRRANDNMLCPLDEIDAAARCLDLIYCRSRSCGNFYKDFHTVPW